MTSLRTLGLVAAALLVLPACDSTESYPIGGTYVEVFDDSQLGRTTSSLTIPNIESGDASFAFSVDVVTVLQGQTVEDFSATGTGTYTFPSISLTVDGETISGTVDEDGETLRLIVEANDPPAVYERQ